LDDLDRCCGTRALGNVGNRKLAAIEGPSSFRLSLQAERANILTVDMRDLMFVVGASAGAAAVIPNEKAPKANVI
jgi:hypothetical protein